MERDFDLGMGRPGGLGGLGGEPIMQQMPQPAPHHPSRSSNDHNVKNLMKQAEENSGYLTLQGNRRKADLKELQFVEDIGHGSCGTVTKCRYKSVIMAVKTMPRTSNSYEMSRILMDLDVICLSFDCPYIVRCFGYFITNFDVRVCMECMATCLDRLLIRIKQPIPERIIGKLSVSIIKALHYLKTKHQIMHRDVKPSNILLDWSGVIKLCDFGIAGRLIESRAHSKQAGCPLYMGPERLDPNNFDSYDIRSDVWSFGVTLVELATGQYPYAGTEFDMMSKILNDEPPRLDPAKFSPDFCQLVESCLQRDPTMRPNYDMLLQHPFVVHHEKIETDVEEWFADVMGECG
ncbi:Dual specificity mitogen-activated protein kinase kinase mek-1 [Caenorhabditis elegans]|uniref:Dual specificity mitogen-activated protein kinase kinase mek-1 n=1 Tax=Caenorhabditis elegans TaxID=6239 RepID=MEK1_CAEEL|nr:Dual specificity mitogen-activated protein kinase kinase mek-1 [Caenorhabditis elegans]Q21307.2 RecName: Full=Dual specificity mitogen-activated protein kinase kinase mek-1 [Caenorhabditis elegans]CCD62387.1 Dual specificity mitogen-activated protein kinase kinase mek-1 [Caenorhabditis elegans]|eukprot:NP_001024771.1 Dual specificity mitogen-activated protein kinase kinase mek-1 [Caenorhabditis elegans]